MCVGEGGGETALFHINILLAVALFKCVYVEFRVLASLFMLGRSFFLHSTICIHELDVVSLGVGSRGLVSAAATGTAPCIVVLNGGGDILLVLLLFLLFVILLLVILLVLLLVLLLLLLPLTHSPRSLSN